MLDGLIILFGKSEYNDQPGAHVFETAFCQLYSKLEQLNLRQIDPEEAYLLLKLHCPQAGCPSEETHRISSENSTGLHFTPLTYHLPSGLLNASASLAHCSAISSCSSVLQTSTFLPSPPSLLISSTTPLPTFPFFAPSTSNPKH